MDSTLLKGLRVLETLVEAETPQGLTALSRQLELPKSNIHRTVATLVAAGYVRRHEDLRRYSATLKIWEVGAVVISRNLLRRAAMPFLRSLHRDFQETVYLAILVGTDVMYLEKIEAPAPLVRSLRIAERIPAVFPASGLALLASAPDAKKRVEELARTNSTGREFDPKHVMETLARVRAQGFAVTTNGWNAGARSVAAPVTTRNGQPAGAIGLAGPAERLDDARVEAASVAVRHAANQVAEVMGSEGEVL